MSTRSCAWLVPFLVAWAPAARGAEDVRWWPTQAWPRAVVRTTEEHRFPPPFPACQMMVQSVAGLAARAVNEGRGDEMVWVATDNPSLEDWYLRLRLRRPRLEVRGVFEPWDLVDRFVKKGVIQGYILYALDRSSGEINAHRPGMDSSVNVATSLAGLLDGILVDEALEDEAKRHGLTRLLDARGKTQAWCFATYKDRFNRRMLCQQDPRKPNARDLAIAQKTLTLFGDDAPTPEAMEWLEPLSPILGWNGGDEFETTRLSSRLGHIQTATDWCMNLPLLMAGSDPAKLARVNAFDPRTIDGNDRRSAISFVSTDGDNVQWLETSFFRGNPDFWSSPDRGKVPFGWSSCFAHLAQLCPEAIDLAAGTRTGNDTFLEWGGGYYYPDLFASGRADRWKLLAGHARRTRALMRGTNTRIIGFNVARLDSPEARKACEVFVKETDGLLAILVFQYSPYEAGEGRTFWVKDRDGVEVPVISARYSIWEHTNERPRSGTPAKVAREVRESAAASPERNDWVIVHAWSYFRRAPGGDEDAENLPQADARTHGGVRGYTPAVWCAERLPASIHVVGPEEMAWRVRMSHNPEQTKRAIAGFRP